MAKDKFSLSLDPALMEDIDLLAEHKYSSDRDRSRYCNDVLTAHRNAQQKTVDELRNAKKKPKSKK